jgi:hypothetical protein
VRTASIIALTMDKVRISKYLLILTIFILHTVVMFKLHVNLPLLAMQALGREEV